MICELFLVILYNGCDYVKLGGRRSRLACIFAFTKIVTKLNLGGGWLVQPEPHSRCCRLLPPILVFNARISHILFVLLKNLV